MELKDMEIRTEIFPKLLFSHKIFGFQLRMRGVFEDSKKTIEFYKVDAIIEIVD